MIYWYCFKIVLLNKVCLKMFPVINHNLLKIQMNECFLKIAAENRELQSFLNCFHK